MLIRVPSVQCAHDLIPLTGAVAHHLIRVRRVRVGEALHLTDGGGMVLQGTVASIEKTSCHVLVHARTTLPKPRPRITLACALLPRERFRLVLEKSVELGVGALIPLRTARTVIAPADRDTRKHAHWQAIMESAAAQCGQAWWPTLALITALHEVIASSTHSTPPQLVICWEGFAEQSPAFAQTTSPFAHCDPATLDPTREILCCIGPEGGFAPEEIDACARANALALNLGPLALRTETAALAALVRLQAPWNK